MTRFSIITSTYNAEKYLAQTIGSVLQQSCRDFEYLIIDGGSTDGTLDIIRKYEQQSPIRWISEKDSGIYDAWNKGVKMAEGEWILFLGADDVILKDALADYAAFLDQNSSKLPLDFVSSQLVLTGENLEPRRLKGAPWIWKEFQYINHLAHPGALHNRRLFQEYGLYDTRYKITGDYELLLRPGSKLRTAYMPKLTVYQREGGTSAGMKALREQTRAVIETGKASPFKARFNYRVLVIKWRIKMMLDAAGFNIYLRKARN